MIRFLFRLLATLALAVAVIMAVLDATRSIAASALVLTPLGESWQSASPATFETARQTIGTDIWAPLWDPGMLFILAQPGFVVFAVLALLFYLVGYRPRRAPRRFAAG